MAKKLKKPKIKEIKKDIKIKEIKSEEQIEQDLSENEFTGFLRPVAKFSAPVLERVQEQQKTKETINLEENVGSLSASLNQENKKENRGNYILNQPQYSVPGSETKWDEARQIPVKPLTSRAVKNRSNFRKVEMLNPFFEMGVERNIEQNLIRADVIDNAESRKLPFERDERKYKDVEI